jgi:uncharacterized membrane protein
VERGRLEAFSDGVIAVAITLLALNLFIAGPGHGPLITQLSDRWPSFVAYLISFLTIGIVWVNHHELIRQMVVDRIVLFVNLFLLMFVVLIPFATGTMAAYLTSGDADAHLSMALYILVLMGMAIAFGLLFGLSLRHRASAFLALPKGVQRFVIFRFTAGNAAYVVALIVAFISPPIALLIVGIVAVYYVFDNTSRYLVPGSAD